MTRICLPLTAVLILGWSAGCVRRTLTIRTQPEGATVWVNDEEVGQSPASVDFTWYGDYDIVCRKEGFQPLLTHHRVNRPWYQIVPIDFFAEVLTPWTYEDRQTVEFKMEPERLPGRAELISRARELRERALFGEK